MRGLAALTLANVRSYVRDRAALFWTLAFPLIFIFLFGFIFQGGGGSAVDLAWVDQDHSTESTQLRAAFAAAEGIDLTDTTRDAATASMQDGQIDAVVVVPAGYGAAVTAAASGTAAPANVTLVIDPSRQELVGAVYQAVGSVLGVVNLGGRPPLVVPVPETIQTENLMFISYFVPSMLALSVMQVGIFAAIPLTYLADALRQVMVGGVAFASLAVCAAVLLAWLVVCFAIASRKFRWQ
jgi:ABC-2 type transport system permease protein